MYRPGSPRRRWHTSNQRNSHTAWRYRHHNPNLLGSNSPQYYYERTCLDSHYHRFQESPNPIDNRQPLLYKHRGLEIKESSDQLQKLRQKSASCRKTNRRRHYHFRPWRCFPYLPHVGGSRSQWDSRGLVCKDWNVHQEKNRLHQKSQQKGERAKRFHRGEYWTRTKLKTATATTTTIIIIKIIIIKIKIIIWIAIDWMRMCSADETC